MFAKNLEHLLLEFSHGSDVASVDANDMAQRFSSLRSYGRLPQGRENQAMSLSNEHVASAILGLATIAPGWAGHAAIVLSHLQPVGGTNGAFGGCSTLHEAIAATLGTDRLREEIDSASMSVSEAGVNSNGYASILYHADGASHVTHYVSPQAVSLLQPGAEEHFDGTRRYALISRELTFGQPFFDRLAKRVEQDRRIPATLRGDGSEYDAGEAEQKRRQKLGVTRHSRFLHIGVDNHVGWPREEQLVTFDRYTLVLMPKTREHVQSVHIDLHANAVTIEEGRTVINRFLSLLSWCDDHFAIAQDGWAGNPIPVPVAKRDLAFTTTSHWLFDRTIPTSENQRRALALYRDARNAEHSYMVSYAVLNYYKIIEILHSGWPASTKWVAENLPEILSDQHDRHGLNTFLAACGSEAPEMYIYAACRVAVAHVSPNRASDPDDVVELRRLHNAADIMRRLARRFIAIELSVSESIFDESSERPT